MSATVKNDTGIAIVGMSGRFPKARNLEEFWRNLCDGVEAISFFTEEELAEAGVAVPSGKTNFVKARAVLEDAGHFDAAFFGMNPKEAELTDPQHRLFLECAWQALENANCDPQRFGRPIGVFAGMSTNTYLAHNLGITPALTIGSNGEFQTMIGNERDYLPTRVSYKLNLKGPSLNIQTACSTSLVAVSVACQHLLTYQCDLALAGAVSVSFPQQRAYVFQEGGITSPDGHCRPFDADSAGTVSGDGVGVVALKRLEDALADGDAIYAVIKGFATNNDGSVKMGYTAPSVEGQAEVIAMAQAMAGFEPETISYIEAHGTGTPLGDPIEIEALTKAFRVGTSARNICAIGSVKGNIGHLDTAAGIAGLIKTALMLHHRKLPPSLHFKSPNPKIDFAESPFQVNASLAEWKNGNGPRRAGVSSFGIGGTNAHIVLEEAPVRESSGASRPAQLLLLSAKTKGALFAAVKNLVDRLREHPDARLADLAYTLQTGRRGFEHRAALVCRHADAAAEALAANRFSLGTSPRENPPVVFMFPGQGAQRVNMGRQLYEVEPAFRETVEHCCKLLESHLGFDLRAVLYPIPDKAEPAERELKQTSVTQPAMFVIEYALAKLWMSWGVRPAAMIGHSIGEYVAATIAGVFSLDDALKLIAARGRLMQSLPGGTMLAVRVPESEVKSLLNENLSLAAVNSAGACVVSGPSDAMAALTQQLTARKIGCVALQTSHAFHSAMMEPILTEFTELVRSIKCQPPQIPFISNVTGTWITKEQATDPAYWATHLRQAVRFADGLNELFKSDRVFLEVGPGQTLSGFARQHPARQAFSPVVATLAQAKDGASDLEAVLNALGQLWLHGVAPAWDKFYAHENRRRVWLPSYPFERKRFWVEPPRRRSAQPAGDHNGAVPQNSDRALSIPTDLVVMPVEIGRSSQTDISTHARLRRLISNLSGLEGATVDGSMTFTQLGFDSLFLTQAGVAIERDFGVRVAFRHLIENYSTLDALAAHLDRNLPIQPPSLISNNGHGDGHARFDTNELDPVTLAPLTESQREIWFASQMSEGASCVYNECRLLYLRGSLQAGALREALQKLIARHEALRTTFAPVGDVQRIHPSLKADLALVDWSHLASSERALRLDAAQIEEARQPFDLVAGPLVRARLICLGKDHHVFVLTVHHLVCDGYSFGILLRELGELYSAECGGVKNSLSRPLQFSTYARQQAEREHSPAHLADERYWLEQFAAEAPMLELPADRARVSDWKFDGAREWRTLSGALGDKLKKLSAEQGCTLFTTMFAAYTLWLRKLSGQKEVVVGVPLADRAMADGETLVGHCVNFLPLRGHIDDDRPFTAHLASMQKVFLDADEHGRYAFGTLLQKLNLSRDPGRMPLVSATFNLERLAEELKFSGVETEWAGNAHAAASFDLSFDVTDAPDGLHLNCRYNTGLFSAPTIQRWLGHFKTLLEAITADPRRRMRDLSLLTEAEQRRILFDWNRTKTDYPRDKCIHQVFEQQAARTPDSIAVESAGTRLAYREVNERANRLAHYLQKRGVRAGSVVALCFERSADTVVALLGILKAGGAYLPLDPSHPKERLALMLQDAHALLVLTQEKFRPSLPQNSGGTANATILCMSLIESELAREPATNPDSDATAESLAYISFTSGSTGTPKGVCIPHRAVVRLVKGANCASFSAEETFLQLAPLAFDASTFEIWGALLNGARLVVFSPHTPSLAELGEFIQTHRISTLWLTAGLFHQMIDEQAASLRGVRQLLAGGDVLSVPQVQRALKELPDCKLINGYGPTENTTFTCCHAITRASVEARSIPIGRPIANTQVYVLDEHLQPTPVGVPGELHASGDGLAHGYVNHSELTAKKFSLNPFSADPDARLYKTGDRVRWLPDGSLEFLGRADAQVKINGHRVEPGEIESVLSRHPVVCECAVVAHERNSQDKRLTAFFVSRNSALPTADELREHLRHVLPEYMIPSAFVPLDSLPLTPTGKTDRKSLATSADLPIESSQAFVPAHDDLEQRLTNIWQEVLEHDHVGANDDFFELGGHSLLALRLIARVETVFGKKIPVAGVFHARTVAQMAELLREKCQPPRATAIVEIQPQGSRPPLLFVHGAGGGMFWGYSALAQRLGENQPVYAFKSRGVDGHEEFATIEEMARHYVEDLRAFQRHGPYHLGGYCFGGNVAYEMARQLNAQGEKVALLALINCMPPNSTYDRVRFSAAFCAKFFKNLVYWGSYVLHLKQGHRGEFLRWKLRAIRTKIFHKLRLSRTAPLDFDIEDFVDLTAQPEGRRNLWEAHVQALFQHEPKPYAGDIALFRTRGHSLLCSFDEAFGWNELAAGGVKLRIISGAHETIMGEPHVRLLAEQLRECLDSCVAENTKESGSVIPHQADGEAKCLHQMFEAQAVRTPDAVAVSFGSGQLSYAELNRRADALAARLRRLGIGPNVPVGICLERSVKMGIAVLAVLKAGGAYVPLDPAYPKERLKFMIENVRPPVVLTQFSLRNSLDFSIPDLQLLCLDEEDKAKSVTNKAQANGTPSPNHLAYVIHTSGSTGAPKGVAMPHRPLVNLIDWQLRDSKLGVAARTLQFASLSFDVSFQEMFSTWCAGGTLVLMDEKLRRDPVALLRFIAAEKIERLFLPFVALQQLAEAFGEHTLVPSSLREIITAGEQLQITPKIVKLCESLPGCTLHNHYGPSESHVVTAFTLGGAPSEWPALPPIGRAIPSARIHLLDEQRRPVPEGETGEIYIGGDCLARGYLHQPDLTAEKFIPDPFSTTDNARLYRTGDLGLCRPDGNIEFLGRADHQVKIRGFRIELGEIETTLRQHPGIRDAVVVAREDQPGNRRLIAYFIGREPQAATADALRQFLGEKLPDYMVPSQFVPLESLPLTPSGKVDRKNLPAPAPERNITEHLTAPRTATEETLAGIWREVLSLAQIGIHDNFFHLGGHSLLATQVVSRIRQALQIEVPVADFFEAPTIALLAEGLGAGRWKKESALVTIAPAPRDGRLPLSYSQQRLWFMHQLEPGGFAYNIPAVVALDGELSAEVLKQCLEEMVCRHEILRTTFTDTDGEAAQTVRSELAMPLPLTDLGGEANRDALARDLIQTEAQRSFDLARGPLLRCRLLRLEQRKHILVLVMHHIISDGWSLGIFFQELAQMYEARVSGRPATLPPLVIQYADYALWQRDPAQEELFEQHSAYWRTSLADGPSSLKLPIDHASSPEQHSRGAHCSVAISSHVVDSMRRLNRRENTTPFMTLLTALAILLNRWSREVDIVVGTVSAGRTRPEVERLVGCFMNFLPLRLVVPESEAGLDLLRGARAVVLKSQAHQDCPFERIVAAVRPERSSASSPIYNVGFLLQNFPEIAFATQQLTGKFLPVETDSALLDLRFIADEAEAGYTLTCEYRTPLFERETIEHLLVSFGKVLELLVTKPETKISQFATTPELEEQARRSRTPQDSIAITATFTAEPLAEPLEFWMRELDLPAQIQFAPYSQIFQQLLDPASLLSRNAHGLNVVLMRLEDWVRNLNGEITSALEAERKIEQTLGDLISALHSGAARNLTPILVCVCPPSGSFAGTTQRKAFLERMHQTLAGALASAANVRVLFPEQMAAAYPVEEFYDRHGDELGHVPYTPAFFAALATLIARKFNAQKRPSPKAIVLDCDQTLWSGVCGEDGPDGVKLDPPRRALQEFMREQLSAGRLLCLCSKNNPEDVHTLFQRRKDMPLKLEHFAATRINWRPKSENLKALADELNLAVESLVLVDDNPVECAEVEANCPGVATLQLPDSPEMIPQFLKHCWLFDHQAVTSEDKQRTDFYRRERQRARARADSLSLGDFLATLDLNIQIGELTAASLPRAAQLTQRTNQFNSTTHRRTEKELEEILRDRDATALTISVRDRFGDYGLVGLMLCKFGRESAAVETFLLSCRALGRGVEHRMLAHLGGMAKSRGLDHVDVHFVPSAKNQPALDFLESVGAQFRQPLNGGQVFRFPTESAMAVAFTPVPDGITPIALLPRSEPAPKLNGHFTFNRWRWIALEAKDALGIQKLIEAKAGVSKSAHAKSVEPATETERQLGLIWQELLRIERVDRRDNFFELGGHSLLAVQLFAQIERQLHVKLPLITIFQSPTVEQLARAIGPQELGPSDSCLLPIQSEGNSPPLFLVHGAGGDVLWGYANLAHHTERDQPIYGIQACGSEEFSTLEEMAAHYVEAIRAFQPCGPYRLGGYCFGGNVAQEMARQLEAQGESVALLALLDCAPSNCGYETIHWLRPTLAFDFARNVFYWMDDFFNLKREQRRSLVQRKLRTLPRKLWGKISRQRAPEEFELEEFIDVKNVSERETRLWKNHLQLLVRHVSKPCRGPITLFRTRGHPLVCSFEHDLGWGKLAGGLAIERIPGSHEGIFMEPHVRTLARQLNSALRATSSRYKTRLPNMV